ncbi:MAG: hypothetical protein LBT25_09435 [Candidatus Symbiothrix sp.]|nr:hypothetical protein [Candidatus Symbiothrix sp.]
MARVIKEKMGLDVLLSMECNMTDVEAAYGKEWLSPHTRHVKPIPTETPW